MRRGTGWAVGVATVVFAATVPRDGPREAIKAMMKVSLRGRGAAAELSERLRDGYAEARIEHATQPPDGGE